MKVKSVTRAAVALLCFEAGLTMAFAQGTPALAVLVVPQNLDPTQPSLTINFHNQAAGATSTAQTITLWNISPTTISGLQAQLTAGKFTISSSNCSPNCSLGPGQHATIQVTFSSSTLGPFSSTLSFSGSTSGLLPIPSVTLTGTAVSPPASVPFSVNPAYGFHGIGSLNNNGLVDGDLYFGNQSIGATACAARVYLSNGTASSTSVTATLSPSGGPFTISVAPPGTVLKGVNSASLGVTYTPTGTSGDTVTLNVKFGGVVTQSLTLHGNGFTTSPTTNNIPFIDMGNNNRYLASSVNLPGGLFDGNFGASGDTGCNSPTS
jgi:hypothetical protein